MSNDEVKRFLLRAWNVNKEREEDFERIQRLRSQLTKVTTSYGNTPSGSRNNDKMGEAIVLLTTMESEYRNHIAEYFRVTKEIENLIDTLEQQSHRRILKLRYLDFLKWESIAGKMCYDIRHVIRMHHEAIEKLADKL